MLSRFNIKKIGQAPKPELVEGLTRHKACPVYHRKVILQKPGPLQFLSRPQHPRSGQGLERLDRIDHEFDSLLLILHREQYQHDPKSSRSVFYFPRSNYFPHSYAFQRVVHVLRAMLEPQQQERKTLLWEIDLNPTKPQHYQLALGPGQEHDEAAINARYDKLNPLNKEHTPKSGRDERRELALKEKAKEKIVKKMRKDGLSEEDEGWEKHLQGCLDAWVKKRGQMEQKRAVKLGEMRAGRSKASRDKRRGSRSKKDMTGMEGSVEQAWGEFFTES